MIDDVAGILRDAAEAAILPRFRSLLDGDVVEKSPGDLVTVADREAEALITRRLQGILDVPVVGEEATAADPSLLEVLRGAPAAWVVDPLDGTANFVAGSPDYAVMAALVKEGESVAAWILQPATGRLYVAEKGSGAWRDGVRVVREPAQPDAASLSGMVLTKFLDEAARQRVADAAPRFRELGAGFAAAGIEYPRIADGSRDFVLFRRTLPWDHAPGVLLLTEAGGFAQRPSGVPYRLAEEGTGLLVAADEACWRTAREILVA